MIPKIIHYCWFGRSVMPKLVTDCIASWHKYMPDWEYTLWNEANFDVTTEPYVREAYEAKKYAFVSDYVRLAVLKQYGGLYMDVDFEVYKSFDDLLDDDAFAGFEGSKTNPVMMGVIASAPNGIWVSEQLANYENRHFMLSDGTLDLTTNVRFITDKMIASNFLPNGKEQYYKDLHVYPVSYFCPRLTTGEYVRTIDTYCEHKGLCSWDNPKKKPLLLRFAGPKLSVMLIKIKRALLG